MRGERNILRKLNLNLYTYISQIRGTEGTRELKGKKSSTSRTTNEYDEERKQEFGKARQGIYQRVWSSFLCSTSVPSFVAGTVFVYSA
jgi:hypothetical protein